MKKFILESMLFFVISFCVVQISLSNFENYINHKLVPEHFISPRKNHPNLQNPQSSQNPIRSTKIPTYMPQKQPTYATTTGIIMVQMLNKKVNNYIEFTIPETEVIESLAKKMDNKELENFMLTAFSKDRQQFIAEAKQKLNNDVAYNLP